MTNHLVNIELLMAMLDGALFANALRTNGKPCRIRLPDDLERRTALVVAHLNGTPATLTFHADGFDPWREQVEAVVLSAFCPAADGLCRWVAVDLDGSDHGDGGLADPVHAVRVLAERADNAGLSPGLVVARSRRGMGRHVFLLLPEATPLQDAVIGTAAFVAAAFKVAGTDVEECDSLHAFRCANGEIARAGDAGAIELFPRSSAKPPYGWAITLPGAGAFAKNGGGILVDPFTDCPFTLNHVPCCHREAWTRLVAEVNAILPPKKLKPIQCNHKSPVRHSQQYVDALDHIDPRTNAFINGRTAEGARNKSAFAASMNLLACGVDERRAEQLIVVGATACGLTYREAQSTFRSAARAWARRPRRS